MSPSPLRSRLGRIQVEERRGSWGALLRRTRVSRALTAPRLGAALGLVLLALLPSVAGPHIVPYHLHQELRHPLYARVGFTWEHPAETERIEREVRESFPRYYEVNHSWAVEVVEPVFRILSEAHALAGDGKLPLADAAARLIEEAKKQKTPLDADGAGALVAELREKGRTVDLYEDVIVPIRRRILHGRSLSAGILGAAHFREELRRPITLVSYWKETSDPVGSGDGPISLEQTPRLIEDSIDAEFSRFRPAFRRTLSALLVKSLKPSLTPMPQRTEEAIRAAIAARLEAARQVRPGELLVPLGKPLSAIDLDRLRSEAAAYEAAQGPWALATRLSGIAALLCIAALGFVLYLQQFERGVFRRSRHLAAVLLLGVLVLDAVQVGVMAGLQLTLVPVGVAAGVVALVFGPRVGVGAATLLGFAGFVTMKTEIGEVIALLGSSWVFSCLAPGVRHRSGLLRAGLVAGGVDILGTNFWRMAGGFPYAPVAAAGDWWELLVWSGAWDALFWVGGSVALTMLLPFLERLFGAATNVTLLELSDQEHPLLRRLVLDAPGTYHHSVIVGNLAEAAAEAVGANPLLARVGSYYHDVGKILKPEYFNENDTGRSRHDRLAPTLSALIIIAHVKDGVEMAQAYRLPRALLDMIEQHHGDGVVGFFYARARELASDPDAVPEAAFRYPGPRPQSAEAAIVLLADSVEASSRSLAEPSPAHIDRLVHRIVVEKTMQGQIDESPLTFRDLAVVEKSFARTLNAMYHSRVRYPDWQKKNGAGR